MEKCENIEKLLRAEVSVIKKHVDKHKWFRQIPDKEKAIGDFIDKYGWLMRELYCGYVCEDRDKCELAKKFVPGPNGIKFRIED